MGVNICSAQRSAEQTAGASGRSPLSTIEEFLNGNGNQRRQAEARQQPGNQFSVRKPEDREERFAIGAMGFCGQGFGCGVLIDELLAKDDVRQIVTESDQVCAPAGTDSSRGASFSMSIAAPMQCCQTRGTHSPPAVSDEKALKIPTFTTRLRTPLTPIFLTASSTLLTRPR